jgi:uncharacterized membrane protein
MKTLKKILIAIVIIVAIPLIAALFVSKNYQVEREIIIGKPKMEVFDYMKYLKNQDEFSVWAKMDPNMTKTFKGTDGEVGFVSGWKGNEEVGEGEQEIIKIVEGERIDYKLRFIAPFESVNDTYYAFEDVDGNSTKVVWNMSGNMPYPFNLMGLFMNMDEEIGKDFETGLSNLKTILEE